MLKKRDAQGLSIQIIILVVIGLIVLVVLIAIFTKETGRTVSTLESCGVRGGTCKLGGTCDDGREIIGTDCESKTPKKICCVRI